MSLKITAQSGNYLSRTSDLGAANAGTLAFWHRRTNTDATNIMCRFGNAIQLFYNSSGAIDHDDASGAQTPTTPFTHTLNEWAYYAIAWNGASGPYKVYAWNEAGDLTTVHTGVSVGGTPTAVRIGDANYNLSAVGEYRYARVWNAELNTTQLAAERASATPIVTTDLKAHWLLADAADVADDYSTLDLTKTGTGFSTSTEEPPTGGASVAITSVSDDTLFDAQPGIIISGSGFGASQGSGVVLISPTDDVDDAGAVEQTVTSWADDSITFTAELGTLSYNTTYYLFVKENGGTSNASGEAVMFYDPAAGLTIVRRRAMFVNDIIIQY